MLTIKNKFILFHVILMFALTIHTVIAKEIPANAINTSMKRVEQLFKQNPETLSSQDVLELSNTIIPKREQYPNEIIAKTYFLLANIAINKAEYETAFQFIQDGLAITSPQQESYLCLQVKLASVLTTQQAYNELLNVTQQALIISKKSGNIKNKLFLLSYQTVAFAMLDQHSNALSDLLQIQQDIKNNPTFNEHITFLSILAKAYAHLGEYDTALIIQRKVLKLRFNLKQLGNIDQTYYELGNAYFHLNKYNDAYNAFWEAKQYAEKKHAPISTAYAEQGLGLTLLKQQQYQSAEDALRRAKQTFFQQSLTRPYIETMISLSQVKQYQHQLSKSYLYLNKVVTLLENNKVDNDYIIIYKMLADMYFQKEKHTQAYFWQKKYIKALETINAHKQNKTINITHETNYKDGNKSKRLAINLAEQSELTSEYTNKFQRQKIIIILLSFFITMLAVVLIFIWLIRLSKRTKDRYEQPEITLQNLENPSQTKQIYKTHFTMAKKYCFTLTLGYISIDNWQALEFKYNKKIVQEVRDAINVTISESINEFEQAGLINHGEYLLIFPHQNKEQATETINNIIASIQSKFFANLGSFSVTLSSAVGTPCFQDIDPYIYLSNLTSSAK